jgi:two-component system, sensor histidine kinase LadS
MPKWLFFFLGIFSKALPQNALITVPEKFESYHIQKDFYVYTEPTEAAESIELVHNKNFVPTKEKVAAYFASFQGHWLKFTLKSPTNQSAIINLGPLSFDELAMYEQQTNGSFKKYPEQNWQTPIGQRPLQSYFYGYKINLKAHTPHTFYIRGKNPKGTFRMPLKLNSELGFRHHLQQQHLFYGIFFGVGIFILFVGFTFYLLSKEISYLFYFISVLTLIIHNAGLNGFFVGFMQKYVPFFADPTSANVLTVIFVFFHIRFIRELLLHRTKTPRAILIFSKLLAALTLILSVAMFAVFIDKNFYKVVSYLIYIIYVGMITNFALHIWQGFKYRRTNAFFITLSTTPFILLMVYLVLVNLRIVKQTTPYNTVMWCLMFDNIILCIGLAFRFNNVINRQVGLQKQINEEQQKAYQSEIRAQSEQFKLIEARYNLQLEKERISRDLHDNIGSQLAHITSELDYYAKTTTPDTPIKTKLSALGTDVRYATQQLRDTIWALNNEDVNLEDWTLRVQQLYHKQFENHSVKTIFDNQCTQPNLILSSVQSLNMFRVFQEAFNNIKKHSQCTEVVVLLKCVSTTIYIDIIDNGLGFTASAAHKESYGLANMLNRIESINGAFEIKSTENGTQLKMQIPLAKAEPV